ncbi:unnamed protein product [Fraxinus pennsylvanica]|uniref:Uncharacterized protein n=1 Tax=Fraxinus pennsylvanica TaxID=56036 RepID=A0AAD2A8N3_9LAMI|nr:unnamed protein product [Fraxinus pennsylvanica]
MAFVIASVVFLLIVSTIFGASMATVHQFSTTTLNFIMFYECQPKIMRHAHPQHHFPASTVEAIQSRFRPLEIFTSSVASQATAKLDRKFLSWSQATLLHRAQTWTSDYSGLVAIGLLPALREKLAGEYSINIQLLQHSFVPFLLQKVQLRIVAMAFVIASVVFLLIVSTIFGASMAAVHQFSTTTLNFIMFYECQLKIMRHAHPQYHFPASTVEAIQSRFRLSKIFTSSVASQATAKLDRKFLSWSQATVLHRAVRNTPPIGGGQNFPGRDPTKTNSVTCRLSSSKLGLLIILGSSLLDFYLH